MDTQKPVAKNRSDNRAIKKTARLESELKKTPMYVEQGAPPAPGPEPEGELKLKYWSTTDGQPITQP